MISRTQYQFHAHRGGRGGGRPGTPGQDSSQDQHWNHIRHNYPSNSNNQVTTQPGSNPGTIVTPFRSHEMAHIQPSTDIDNPATAHLMVTAAERTVIQSSPNDSSITCIGTTTTYTAPDNILTLLQAQMENMQMKQATFEQRVTESNTKALSLLEQGVQQQIHDSLRDSEQRQTEQNRANNATLQAELAKNKKEVSNELSAIMQYLQMLNDNAVAAKKQSDEFQHTLLKKLEDNERRPILSQVQHTPINHAVKAPQHQGAQTKQQPLSMSLDNSTQSGSTHTISPVPMTTPATTGPSSGVRIGTLGKRQQQQSILATMSRIGQTKEKGGDIDMSRPGTDHEVEGITLRPDPGSSGSAHHT